MSYNIINNAFTIFVIISCCVTIISSFSTYKILKHSHSRQLIELSESLQQLVIQAEKAQKNLVTELKLGKENLSQLLSEMKNLEPKISVSKKESKLQNHQKKSNDELQSEELPNESWLTSPSILKSAQKIQALKAYSPKQNETEDNLGNTETTTLNHYKYQNNTIYDTIHKKLKSTADKINLTKSPNAIATNSQVTSESSITYNIAKRLLRDGKSPESIAKKLDLQLDEVLSIVEAKHQKSSNSYSITG